METIKNKNGCISKKEVEKLIILGKKIVIIDVRSNEEYNEKHIPNAINIPLDKLENEAKTFDKNKFYVTACGKGGSRSTVGAEKLKYMKFNALWLCSGSFGWFI